MHIIHSFILDSKPLHKSRKYQRLQASQTPITKNIRGGNSLIYNFPSCNISFVPYDVALTVNEDNDHQMW